MDRHDRAHEQAARCVLGAELRSPSFDGAPRQALRPAAPSRIIMGRQTCSGPLARSLLHCTKRCLLPPPHEQQEHPMIASGRKVGACAVVTCQARAARAEWPQEQDAARLDAASAIAMDVVVVPSTKVVTTCLGTRCGLPPRGSAFYSFYPIKFDRMLLYHCGVA